ncbi:MAG: hypothetical protein ACI3ZO_05420 [Candidatus Cryptobacteroides sp.]|nr:hypothetical protein [Bacteroidales bacterium]
MNRLFAVLASSALLLSASPSFAQQTPDAKEFKSRYDNIVARVGAAGVGVETLLDKWEAAYPDDLDMLLGRFYYCFTKSQSTSIVEKETEKYLGEKPVLSLKDSTGRTVNYFQEVNYDDELFGTAQKALDKAIQTEPDRLDLRFIKVASLIGYEKESPDMALSDLKSLVDYNGMRHPAWTYPGEDKVDADFFSSAIQEYCYLFFRYGTPASFEAFKSLSEKMLVYEPSNVLFLDNLGSYSLVVAKDSKTALKYYNKVLKIKSDDMTAIKNVIILARNDKNEKLEKKYLPMMMKYSQDEAEKLSAKARLDFLNGKK